MERITDREAVAKLARAILGQGGRSTTEDSMLELLFAMSEKDEVSKGAERGYKRAVRPAQTA